MLLPQHSSRNILELGNPRKLLCDFDELSPYSPQSSNKITIPVHREKLLEEIEILSPQSSNKIIKLGNAKKRAGKTRRRAAFTTRNEQLVYPFSPIDHKEILKDLSPELIGDSDSTIINLSDDGVAIAAEDTNLNNCSNDKINFTHSDFNILEQKDSHWNDNIIDFWMRWYENMNSLQY